MKPSEIRKTLSELDLPGQKQAEKIAKYYQIVLEVNAHTNITAITEPDQFLARHVVDCLWLAKVSSLEGTLVDVGSGAGFPGLLLALCLPRLQVTLIDAAEKKVEFLRRCCKELEVDAAVIHGRAESLGRSDARGSFDWVVARALAPLPVLAEYCLPLARTGGVVAAYKGPAADEEIRQASAAIDLLGGACPVRHSYLLPDGSRRTLILMDKKHPTPDKYPRRPGVPARKPLANS